MVDRAGKNLCNGCKLCAEICPRQAIHYETDSEGFWYPKVDAQKCVSCGQCVRRCPNQTPRESRMQAPDVKAAWSKDDSVRLASTSGGIFYELAREILSRGGYVTGCVYTEDFRAAHQVMIHSMDELAPLLVSKYLESDAGGIYPQVKQALDAGAPVLFVGTPCQCAAMDSYLNEERENLILCDFLCRGANSPKAHAHYVAYLESKYGAKMVDLRSKDKRNGWNHFGQAAKFANGREYYSQQDLRVIAYHQGNLMMRLSCNDCKFKTIPRVSDITLGDFWGIDSQEVHDVEKGISLVLLNSEKGKKLFSAVRDRVDSVDKVLTDATPRNPALYVSTPKGKNRDAFLRDLDRYPFNVLVQKYRDERPFWMIRAVRRLKRMALQTLRSETPGGGEMRIKRIVRLTKGLLKCNPFQFVYYNFLCGCVERERGCYLLPGRSSVIRLRRGAKLRLEGNVYININTAGRPRMQTHLVLEPGAELRVRGDVHLRFGSTVIVNPGAKAEFGHFTSNVCLNIYCDHSITVGDDCMIGRNVTIYDSTFHPVGTNIRHMRTNRVATRIGNHVWLGANSVVLPGTQIGDGSMVGMNATVSGTIPPTAKVVPRCDAVFSVGNLWARNMDALAAAKRYAQEVDLDVTQEASEDSERLESMAGKIRKLLSAEMSGIDFDVNDALVDDGILDSLSLTAVVGLLSDEFGVEIPYTEVCARNFNSVDRMAATLLHAQDNHVGRVQARQTAASDRESIRLQALALDAQDAERPVVQRIFEHSQITPDAAAIIVDDYVTTYRELWRLIASARGWLLRRGVRPGDRVIVRALHSARCVAAFYAVHLTEAILVPVEKTAKRERAMEIAAEVGAKLLIGFEGQMQSGEGQCAALEELFDVDVGEAVLIEFPDLDQPCEMVFTTGTTGKSKGVLMTHRHIAWYAYSLAKRIELKRGNRFLITTPLNHAGGLRRTHLSLANGCTLVYMDGMSDLRAYFDCIVRHRVTALYLPPVAIRILLIHSADRLREFRDQIDFVYSSSSFLPSGDCERMRQLLPGTRLYNAYEASETPGVCAYDYNVEAMRENCLGRANEGVEIGILTKNGTIVAGEAAEGQICVRSRMNMREYYGAAELTASVRRCDWFVSSDLGAVDAEGYLYYHGRMGDVINIGGYKIAPTEVEAVALRSGLVRECICVRECDGRGFDRLKLLVVPLAEPFDAGTLIAFLDERLESYKVPRKVETVAEIWKTFNGKLDRKKYEQQGGGRK